MGKKAGGKSENVQVIVRLRPLNGKEKATGCKEAVVADLSNNCVYVDGAGVDGRAWGFDGVYTNAFSQKDVYLQSIHPVVETVLQGYNATIFAYGQSGTGKTFSMCGNLSEPEQLGIIPNALNHIFNSINEMRSDKLEFYVEASFVELYNGKCRDLLVDGRHNLELKENAQKLFFVKDLTMHTISSTMQAMALMEDGLTRREVKSTELNADSSRSHSLFTVYVRTWDKEQDLKTEAKLNLVDLAGSERQSKTGASGDTLKEGNNINLSLTALGTVIDCLVKGKPHIPYRSSPLTMLLKDGLGGNSRTVIVGTLGPSDANSHETVSTLRFIDRAKQIKNKPKVQMDPKDAKIAELLEEIAKLRKQLGIEEGDTDDGGGGGEDGGTADASAADDGAGVKKKKVRLYDDELEEMRRRLEEMEVTMEMQQQTIESAQQEQTALEAKERRLREQFQEKEAQLLEQISELKDVSDLNECGKDEMTEDHDHLMSLCCDFLAFLDKEKVWIPTVKSKKNKATGDRVLRPSVDDIARGFKMFRGNGVDMQLHVLRRQSFASSPVQHQHHRHHSSGGGGHDGPEAFGGSRPPRPRPPQGPPPSGDDPFHRERDQSPQPPADAAAAASAVGTPPVEVSDVDDLGLPPRKSKKDKKDKKEKKEKKGARKKRVGLLAPLEDAAVSAALPSAVVDAALIAAGFKDNENAKTLVHQLLAQQRTESLNSFKTRVAGAAGREADAIVESPEEAAELLVAFSQLTDEVKSLHDTIEKQRHQIAKSKAVAEKKIIEVGQLKEHIESLREELAGKHAQHAQELAQQQERLIHQQNKKVEQIMQKHTKALIKERKQRDALQDKIRQKDEEFAQMEQEYDVKILEYEALQKDFEQMKLESLKKFKEMGGFESIGGPAAAAPRGDPTERLRNVVQASMVARDGRQVLERVPMRAPQPLSAPVESTNSLPPVSMPPPRSPAFGKTSFLDVPRK